MGNETGIENEQRPRKEPKIQRDRGSTARKVKIGVLALLCVLVVVLILQNLRQVEVNLLFWRVDTPLFLMLPLVFLLGMVIGYILRRK